MVMTRKKEAIASDQPPILIAGTAMRMPTATAATPPISISKRMSVVPWIARIIVRYAPTAYMNTWPSWSSPA